MGADFLFWHTIWCSLWEHSRFVGSFASFKTETALYCSQPRLRSASRPSWTAACSVSWSCWPKSQRPSMFFPMKSQLDKLLMTLCWRCPFFTFFFFCCFQILTTISCSCRSSYRSRLQRGVEIRFVGHGRDWAASWLDSKGGSGIQNMKTIEFFFLKHYLYHVPSRASLYWILRIYSSVW